MNPKRLRAQAPRARTTVVASLWLVTGMVSLAAAANWPQDDARTSRILRSGPGSVNHPIGVRPSGSVRIPAGWPLDAGGRLKCTTCHESVPSLAGRGGSKLRGAGEFVGDSSGFCAMCHLSGVQSGASGMHWMAVQRAHVKPPATSGVQGYGTLDAASVRCLSCHDGVTAQETGYQTASGHGSMSFGGTARNHPVGVRYRAHLSEAGTKLRVRQALPATVRLPEGRVSCVSCHDLYSREPKLLAVPIEGSALCLTCHEMD